MIDDPVSAAEATLELLDAFTAEDHLPQVHAGLAFGPVLYRGGDVYGPVVNIAARLANLARKGTIRIDQALATELADAGQFNLSVRPPRTVRGTCSCPATGSGGPQELMAAPMRIAVLDDYQNVALQMADWSAVTDRADVTVFNDHIADPDELVARLEPFDVVFVMRERTPLPRSIIERLPNLKMIASTGPFNASIDMAAAEDHGLHVGTTGGTVASTVELTWALILAGVRNLVAESQSVRVGGWQTSVGRELAGRTLGVLGLGRIGVRVARIGEAFGMKVIAWSQNLTRRRPPRPARRT